jgi:lysine 2,3-aminomutase
MDHPNKIEHWTKILRKGWISFDSVKHLLLPSLPWKSVIKKLDMRISENLQELIHHPEISKQFVPAAEELLFLPEELEDPIGDDKWSPVPGIVHRYPRRALLTVTYFCPTYCRFCFRRNKVSQTHLNPSEETLKKAIDYIRNTPSLWEVILTGGDPLTLTDQKIKKIIDDIENIDHVKVIRIHTKTFTALPERFTEEFLKILKSSSKSIWIVAHDSLEKLSLVMESSVEIGVKPYYLHYPDLAQGTNHFRIPLYEAISLYKELRGSISGICIPELMVDIPNGYGKVPIDIGLSKQKDKDTWEFWSPVEKKWVTVEYPKT